TASPWAYNGYLFCLNEDGWTYVVKAGPDFEIVARNELDGLCLATPAVADGKLLLRTATQLYCLAGGSRANDALDAQTAPALDVWTAVQQGDQQALLAALEDDAAKIDAQDPVSGLTLLQSSLLEGRPKIALLLIDRGADLSRRANDGSVALHVAAFTGYPDIVQRLLERGASSAVRNGRGQTALDVVAGEWNEEIEGLYRLIGGLLGKEFDLERIKRTRPKVADVLRAYEESPSEAAER
ncbi:MAG: ankyrin repeat domain-containing protein, partial [Planctomycetota bacterium]